MKISLFNKHVTVLDYAYLDDHHGVVGNALWVNVTFIGETDHEGVVYDFSYAKKKVKEIIDEQVDHRLVIPKDLVKKDGDRINFTYNYGFNEKFMTYDSPEQGVAEIPYRHVSYQNLQTYLETIIMEQMPKNISNVQIELEEEPLEGRACFQYTHGLKDHYGNCQRLYHGHRNTIEVYVNGQQNEKLERHLADELFKGNIHFCYFENVQNKDEVTKLAKNDFPEGIFPVIPRIEIAYKSSQGLFKGSLPGNEIYLLQTETTVENLSIHFAKYIKKMVNKGDKVQVKAFEGIGKGALTTL